MVAFAHAFLRCLLLLVTLLTCSACAQSRLTLLLGPPGAGKTTLMKALAGKLGGDVKVHSLPLSSSFVSVLGLPSIAY